MSQSETRERIAAGPSETDIAFAKATKARRVGAEPKTEDVPPMPGKAADDEGELAALREQVSALRAIVMSQKAPTNARRAGEVADAELAAEGASAELAAVIEAATQKVPFDKNGERRKDVNGDLVFEKPDAEKISAMRKNLRELNRQVDIARALAGEIPRNHPGLKHLPPDHPVFRVR